MKVFRARDNLTTPSPYSILVILQLIYVLVFTYLNIFFSIQIFFIKIRLFWVKTYVKIEFLTKCRYNFQKKCETNKKLKSESLRSSQKVYTAYRKSLSCTKSKCGDGGGRKKEITLDLTFFNMKQDVVLLY